MTPPVYRPLAGGVTPGRRSAGVELLPSCPPADDPAGDLAAAVAAETLPLVPDWHAALGGGPHVTPDAVERFAADAIYLRRIGRPEER